MATFFEKWIKSLVMGQTSEPLTRAHIEAYQLEKLKETLTYVMDRSNFYKQRLSDLDVKGLTSLEEFSSRVPFSHPQELAMRPAAFLCLPQHEISRILSITTSATAAQKRIFFTEEDLERTTDFFHHGMTYLVEPGDRVLVLMPGAQDGSIGDLLKKGLRRLGCESLNMGLTKDLHLVLETMRRIKIDCLVAMPLQAYQLARLKMSSDVYRRIKLKSILLSADYLPNSIKDLVEESFSAKVYNHYGMSEMGYGGGVDCSCLCGYHLREADLYFEIVDPVTGKLLPPGERGEVVFTTLTRQAMPLIRYRTGDIAGFLTDDCSCSRILRSLGHIEGRFSDRVYIDGEALSMAILDEHMFRLDNLLDYRVNLTEDGVLSFWIRALDEGRLLGLEDVRRALENSPLNRLVEEGKLTLVFKGRGDWKSQKNTMTKRILARNWEEKS